MNYVPVRASRRRRREVRRVALLVLLAVAWVGGTVTTTVVWWRGNPDPHWLDGLATGALYALGWAVMLLVPVVSHG